MVNNLDLYNFMHWLQVLQPGMAVAKAKKQTNQTNFDDKNNNLTYKIF